MLSCILDGKFSRRLGKLIYDRVADGPGLGNSLRETAFNIPARREMRFDFVAQNGEVSISNLLPNIVPPRKMPATGAEPLASCATLENIVATGHKNDQRVNEPANALASGLKFRGGNRLRTVIVPFQPALKSHWTFKMAIAHPTTRDLSSAPMPDPSK